MIIDWPAMELFVRPGPTDMRKQINGLAVLVESDMKKQVFGKSLFLFCNRERRILKVLYWDRTGFWLMQKRLEKDRFPWPTSSEQAARISYEQLKMLLAGIDFWKAHREVQYRSVS
jgi:transposase